MCTVSISTVQNTPTFVVHFIHTSVRATGFFRCLLRKILQEISDLLKDDFEFSAVIRLRRDHSTNTGDFAVGVRILKGGLYKVLGFLITGFTLK